MWVNGKKLLDLENRLNKKIAELSEAIRHHKSEDNPHGTAELSIFSWFDNRTNLGKRLESLESAVFVECKSARCKECHANTGRHKVVAWKVKGKK